MSRPKGSPKFGGRKKGTPNKKTQALREVIEGALGKTIPEKLFESGIFDKLKPYQQAQVLLELMNYLEPKRKAIEHDMKPGGSLEKYLLMTPEERRAKLAEFQDRLKESS